MIIILKSGTFHNTNLVGLEFELAGAGWAGAQGVSSICGGGRRTVQSAEVKAVFWVF